MKRYLTGAVLIALLLCALNPASGSSQRGEANSTPRQSLESSTSQSEHRPGQILVKFRAPTPPLEAASILAQQDLSIGEEIEGLHVRRVAVPPGQEQAMVERLSQDPRVEYAELDYLVFATIIPNDTEYYRQWGPAKIQAPAAWDLTVGDSDVTIAIVDTGVDLNHPDLDDKIVAGWDFVNDDSYAWDDHGHGTHVAGIAAAETNNGDGVAGISWGALVMPVKVLNEQGKGFYSDVAEGILWACDHGAQIINLSLGGSEPSATLEEAVEEAYDDGCLMVAAAGNGGGDGVDYPARYPETIAVAATDQSDSRASFSDYGPQVDVAAPGVAVYSTLWDNTYGWKDGTSMAAPHVSGLAALVWSRCPGLANYQVQDIIESTADDFGDPGWDIYYGWGRINALDAVEAATPVLTVNTHEMVFLADIDTGPWPQTLLIGNGSPCGTLSWNATDDADWLGIDWLDTDPDGGEASASELGETTVTVDKSGLMEGGTYQATIPISSSTPCVLGSPQLVEVRFVYSDSPLQEKLFPLAMHQ